ncbi:alpha/beta fold hydrolase [Jongsikchunia kroppenstedtii]|uniref:alpha/beta fold hydrolase n=1 Tax=Jongsikchunia kroppenstedtii TaxID=1121721 RepID=UPI00036602A6|nr:alpha/beta hydrolase [Jongsikchunia kroppenstedtii]
MSSEIEVAPGVVLHYERANPGADKTIVLLGGLGMPASTWKIVGLVDRLATAGFSVVSFSARGLAPSSAPEPPYSVADLAADAELLFDHLGLRGVITIGYSMGCYVAQTILRRRPELIGALAMVGGLRSSAISRLVNDMELGLIEKYGELPTDVLTFETIMTTLPPSMVQDQPTVTAWRGMLDGVTPDDPDAHRRGMRGQLEASRAWVDAGEPTDESLAAIAKPVLVIAFEHDAFFPPGTSKQAAELIPGARYVQVDGAAHGGLITHPVDVGNHLELFCLEHR